MADAEKVLKKLNFQVSKNDIEHIITCTPDTIERVLKVAHNKIKSFIDKKKNEDHDPETKKDDIRKLSQNAELKEVLTEKDNTIKELKSTVEVKVLLSRFCNLKSKKWNSYSK